jgi:hypothetical protein
VPRLVSLTGSREPFFLHQLHPILHPKKYSESINGITARLTGLANLRVAPTRARRIASALILEQSFVRVHFTQAARDDSRADLKKASRSVLLIQTTGTGISASR